jgi:hypothetical protein
MIPTDMITIHFLKDDFGERLKSTIESSFQLDCRLATFNTSRQQWVTGTENAGLLVADPRVLGMVILDRQGPFQSVSGTARYKLGVDYVIECYAFDMSASIAVEGLLKCCNGIKLAFVENRYWLFQNIEKPV